MGMRQSVEMTYSGGEKITIYSHWDGDEDQNASPLACKVRKALARRQRWDDESYLGRIIISEILRDSIDDETGYGIWPGDDQGAGEYPTIDVDLSAQTVNGIAFEKFVTLFD